MIKVVTAHAFGQSLHRHVSHLMSAVGRQDKNWKFNIQAFVQCLFSNTGFEACSDYAGIILSIMGVNKHQELCWHFEVIIKL